MSLLTGFLKSELNAAGFQTQDSTNILDTTLVVQVPIAGAEVVGYLHVDDDAVVVDFRLDIEIPYPCRSELLRFVLLYNEGTTIGNLVINPGLKELGLHIGVSSKFYDLNSTNVIRILETGANCWIALLEYALPVINGQSTADAEFNRLMNDIN
jgi:hypothetical protein